MHVSHKKPIQSVTIIYDWTVVAPTTQVGGRLKARDHENERRN